MKEKERMFQILNVEFSTSIYPPKKNFIKKYDKKIMFYNLPTSKSGNAAVDTTACSVLYSYTYCKIVRCDAEV